MKKGSFWQWIVYPLYLYFFLISANTARAQDEVSNYVVVGAFEIEQNAKEWMKHSKALLLDAGYRKNLNRGLYYVYVFQDKDWQSTAEKLHEVRKIKSFPDAWIYTGNFGNEIVMTASSAVMNNVLLDTVEEAYEEPAGEEPLTQEQPAIATPITKEELRKEVIVAHEDTSDVETGELNLGNMTVFFNLFNSQNNVDINGEVQVIDAERAKLLQTVKGGEYTSILNPNNNTGRLSLIVETFGYRKMQYEVNYSNPLADTALFDIDLIGDVLVYHFPLIRYHKGDIVTMYNVYFFKDAAIMVPESKYEVGNLLEMMEENPTYKIRIHGHTNGNSMGKIITTGDDQSFFALTDDDQEKMGSAKRLSKERAQVIKDYLVANGIDPKRMEVKAWGGKRMIYDKVSNLAKKNVRVEIEILEE